MSSVLVSACLLGRACRYDGSDEKTPDLLDALRAAGTEPVSFCPEEAGGLATPRPAAQFSGGDGEDVVDGTARVLTADGEDVTDAFLAGGRLAVEAATQAGCRVAFLKERSPSCGCAVVHNEQGITPGCGVTTALLRRAGIATISVK